MVAEAGELARIRASYELALKKGTIRHHSDKKTKSQKHWGTISLRAPLWDIGFSVSSGGGGSGGLSPVAR